jgi:hypothetical protein
MEGRTENFTPKKKASFSPKIGKIAENFDHNIDP